MRRTGAILLCVMLAACGGGSADSGDPAATTTDGTSTTGGPGGTTTTGGTSTIDVPTTGPDPTTVAEPGTSSGTSGDPTTGEGTSTGDATTGPGLDCADLSDGPWEPALLASGFEGSEDLAFDGQGGLALKRDGGVVVIAADLGETVLTPDIPQAYGTRYLGDGRLLVALPQAGKVVAVDGQGTITDFLTQLQGPNGVYPDLAGNVWITEFGGDRVIRVGPDTMTVTEIVTGNDAKAANGVVFDPTRALLFYTRYQDSQVWRVAIDDEGVPGTPALVVEIAGAAPDGLAMDACGYLYVVDQGNDALYRVLLDAAGEATSTPDQPMAVFPSNVANAQFGVGPGFDERTLYLAGNPGDVYTVAVEFPGAPIVTP